MRLCVLAKSIYGWRREINSRCFCVSVILCVHWFVLAIQGNGSEEQNEKEEVPAASDGLAKILLYISLIEIVI